MNYIPAFASAVSAEICCNVEHSCSTIRSSEACLDDVQSLLVVEPEVCRVLWEVVSVLGSVLPDGPLHCVADYVHCSTAEGLHQFRGCMDAADDLGRHSQEISRRGRQRFTWGSGKVPWRRSEARSRDGESAA